MISSNIQPVLKTKHGSLFEGDCLQILPTFKDAIADAVFADPPFNLNKMYGTKANDSRSEENYLSWCREWVQECVRITKPGGTIFIYNLPKWNIHISHMLLSMGMDFRHWIAIEQKNGLPIQGRLYPAHYSLLYFTKGKPTTFNKIRTPIEVCRHCGGERRDYGGHRNAMNPKGVNLKDIWTDIPPVRHRKFKPIGRTENAISTKILDRIVEMSTLPGDLVVDPFGGSGTTYTVCEKKHRNWLGIEIQNVQPIIERFESEIHHHKNDDYVEYASFSVAAE